MVKHAPTCLANRHDRCRDFDCTCGAATGRAPRGTGNRRLSIVLRVDSWQNLIAVIRHRETRLHTQGNFWAAIQAIERQMEDQGHAPKDHQGR